jgi:uncharacterized membrane protein
MKTILLLNTPYYITLRVLASWSATLLNIIQVVDSLLSKDHSKKKLSLCPSFILAFLLATPDYHWSRRTLSGFNCIKYCIILQVLTVVLIRARGVFRGNEEASVLIDRTRTTCPSFILIIITLLVDLIMKS